MSATDLSEIQNSLRDRTPRTSHQLINRVANRLSTRKGSSGAEDSIVNQEHCGSSEDEEIQDALYTLGQKYGGDAKR